MKNINKLRTHILETHLGNRRGAVLASGAAFAFLLVLVGGFLLFRAPSVPAFSEYAAGEERKEAFFSFMLPYIEERNQEILNLRQELNALRGEEELGWFARRRVMEVAEQYQVEDFDPASEEDWETLLRRVDVVAPSLALAQAANESAWGTSRFARQGNNFYGQWCYEPGCGLVPRARPEGASYEVRAFESVEESVETYIRNLNRNNAYRELRDIREDLREQGDSISGLQLAAGLDRYSERGQEYISELRSMIRYNELDEYDSSLQ